MRALLACLITALIACFLFLGWHFRQHRISPVSESPPTHADTHPSNSSPSVAELTPTSVYAHNLILRRGPDFKVYVRWLRGSMARVRRDLNPSFDDPESFYLDIKSGVLRANIGDIANFLNRTGMKGSPLKNISLSGDGQMIRLKGTLHKGVPLPIELLGELSVGAGNLVRIHVTKIDVLKMPLKAVLGAFHVKLEDLFQSSSMPGIQISGNDIFLDSQTLLPPPRIRGELTQVRIVNPDLEEVYGNAANDVSRVEQWRNFLRLRDGTIDFGKLTMRHADLIMIDVSQDAWFDLDLAHYQDQLVNGYTRVTPDAGLQIFMPDLDVLSRKRQSVSIQWLKNRNLPPPPDVTPQK